MMYVFDWNRYTDITSAFPTKAFLNNLRYKHNKKYYEFFIIISLYIKRFSLFIEKIKENCVTAFYIKSIKRMY